MKVDNENYIKFEIIKFRFMYDRRKKFLSIYQKLKKIIILDSE